MRMSSTKAANTRVPATRGPVGAAGLLAVMLLVWPLRRLSAENRVEYRFSDYVEDADRIKVQTHSVWFEYDLQSKVTVRGNYVNDAISGATPTGGVGFPGTAYESVRLTDERNAGFFEASVKAGRTTTTPQVSYSEESDYRSLGLSLTEAIDFNERNTTLVLGVARNNDDVGRTGQALRYKGNWDFLLGLNQLLGPRTTLTVNLTLGYSDGALSDPYKGVSYAYDLPPYGPYDPANPNFDANPYGTFGPELRPSHKFRQVLYTEVTQYLTPLNASIVASYRFHHDDWGVFAHTAGLEWNQKLGKRVILSPMFRYHYQTAADFYLLKVPTDPTLAGSTVAFTLDNQFYAVEGDGVFESDVLPNPGAYQVINVPPLPKYYSADYRLSELQTFTFGATLAVKIYEGDHAHVTLNLGYQRYEMYGLDGVTPSSVYPKAHIFTIGAGASF